MYKLSLRFGEVNTSFLKISEWPPVCQWHLMGLCLVKKSIRVASDQAIEHRQWNYGSKACVLFFCKSIKKKNNPDSSMIL